MLSLSGGCSTCTSTIPNCFSCDTSTTCNECNPMYYLTSSSTCARCVAACEFCTNNSACIECSLYATLQANNLCTCDTGAFMNTTIQACQICNPGCLACTATTCTQCADTNQLASGTNCVCPTGFYTDLTTGLCSMCSTYNPQCVQCNST